MRYSVNDTDMLLTSALRKSSDSISDKCSIVLRVYTVPSTHPDQCSSLPSCFFTGVGLGRIGGCDAEESWPPGGVTAPPGSS